MYEIPGKVDWRVDPTSRDYPGPPSEHSTRDPWPEGFDVPKPVVLARQKMLDRGWDARVGYSRAYLKVRKRGSQKGMKMITTWKLHHFVRIQARRGGREVHAMWRCPVEKASWAFDRGIVQGSPAGLHEVMAETELDPVTSSQVN